MSAPDPASVGLPIKVFLYTLDQVASMLSLSVERLQRGGYIHYDGQTVGAPKADLLKAVSIAPPGSSNPEWRISEAELVRWMKRKGLRVYTRGYAR